MSAPDPLTALASVTADSLKRGRCLVGRTIAELDEKRAEALRFLVEESDHSNARISQACKAAGIQVGEETISRHRRKGCACPAA